MKWKDYLLNMIDCILLYIISWMVWAAIAHRLMYGKSFMTVLGMNIASVAGFILFTWLRIRNIKRVIE